MPLGAAERRERPVTEKEKRDAGMLYDANNDPAIEAEVFACKRQCDLYNRMPLERKADREALLRGLLGSAGERFTIFPPFACDFGYNLHLGENFFANINCVFLDEAEIRFGDNVFIAPNCSFYTAGHPFNIEQRNHGLEYARPIRVGDNVWFGGGVIVLPGVTIGSNVVIGAGSVVNRDLPDGVLAAGNPARVLRHLAPSGDKL